VFGLVERADDDRGRQRVGHRAHGTGSTLGVGVNTRDRIAPPRAPRFGRADESEHVVAEHAPDCEVATVGSMRTVLLHIGLPKTGTTSIQSMLRRNVARVGAAGYRYPTFLSRANHFELAAYAVSSKAGILRLVGVASSDEHDRFRRQFEEELRRATAEGSWVFTSEHLGSLLNDVEAINRLRVLLRDFERVRVLLYVRRQDTMAVASHSTWIRDGRPHPFELADHLHNADRYDFRQITERWDSVFGRESVELRLYPRESVLGDFAAVAGLGDLDGWQLPDRHNSSLTSAETAFVMEMNKRLPRWDAGPTHTYSDLSAELVGSGRGEELRMSSTDARTLLEQYSASNEWTMQRAENASDQPDFFAPPTDEHSGNLDQTLTLDDALEFGRLLWVAASTTTTSSGDSES
jgi:hypothetical protein